MAKKRTSIKSSSKRTTKSMKGQDEIFEMPMEKETEEANTRKIVCLGIEFSNDMERRKYFTGKLREKLKDPEFRKNKGFPYGSDEEILALSDPPYYTVCPNPFLNDLVENVSSGQSSKYSYHREPLTLDVSEGKHDPIYKAHTYHTKVPPKAIEQFLRHYSEPSSIILDPVCGSGMTGVAASAFGDRYVIQCDLSPAATHIAAGYASLWHMKEFAKVANQFLEDCRKSFYDEFRSYPEKGASGEVKYWVWTDVLVCSECQSEFKFSDVSNQINDPSINRDYFCPKCNATQSKSDPTYAKETIFDPLLKKQITINKKIPCLIVCEVDGRRIKRSPTKEEIQRSQTYPEGFELKRFPINKVMFRDGRWGCLFRSGGHFGMTHAHHFYSWRVLLALDYLWDKILCYPNADVRTQLRFWFMSTAIKCSKLMNYNSDGIGRVMKGSLFISSLTQEVNPVHFLEISLHDLLRSMRSNRSKKGNSFISTGSATNLGMPDNSIDYVFMDPPFGDNLIYSELNFLWECWLGVYTNEKHEIIVNKEFGKDLGFYEKGMTDVLREVHRVLKAGHWISMEFHNSKNAVWVAIQEALEKSGLVIAGVRVLDKKHGSIKQVQTTNAVKQDLIISAYKPNGGLEKRFAVESGTEQGVWDFTRTHLDQLPVFVQKGDNVETIIERQNFLIYDRMVAFHVQRGVSVPVSASEYYYGLTQRFPERDNMYFLSNQVVEYDQKKAKTNGISQMELFVIDEFSAIQWLQRELKEKSYTFQEIHPLFMKEIAGWEKFEKPLELRVLLEQNFLCYGGEGEIPNTIHNYVLNNFMELRHLSQDHAAIKAKAKDRWYIPDPNKAGDLEKLREKALLKEFWEYLPQGYVPPKPDVFSGQLTLLEDRRKKETPAGKKLKVIRLEAVRAGFKYCWQNKDYHTIIAVAGRISENVLQEDPKLLMWFDQAQTRLGENV